MKYSVPLTMQKCNNVMSQNGTAHPVERENESRIYDLVAMNQLSNKRITI